MADSNTLRLVSTTANLSEKITAYVSQRLREKGYASASAPVLGFLSKLECGENYASEIARDLGVSRQMVAKTVKELCEAGYLKQEAGTGKQKKILFTLEGERLISDARNLLLELDAILANSIGENALLKTLVNLDTISSQITE